MKVVQYILGGAKAEIKTGVGAVVMNLAKQLIELGFESEVWGSREVDYDYSGVDILPYRARYFKPLTKPMRLDGFQLDPDLVQALDELDPQTTIFHFHSVFIPEYIPVVKQLHKRGIPWISMPHGGYNERSMSKNRYFKKVYMSLFENYLINHASCIIAIGEQEAKDMARFEWSTPIKILPNGQDFEAIDCSGPKPENLPTGKPLFGFLGRMATRHKGLDLFLEGFKRYKEQGGKGAAALIGYGKDEDSLKAQAARLELSEDVHFLGPVFGKDKFRYIDAFDVFFHTSRWEGMPIALIEASSLGTPLLISEETSMGSFVRQYEAGLVLPNNTPSEIADALTTAETYHENGVLEEMGSNALRMAQAEFDWKKITHRLVTQIYATAYPNLTEVKRP